MLDPRTILQHLGGVARGRTLQQWGPSRAALARAVEDGRILRVRTGVFALPSVNEQIVEAAAHGGSLTCGTALRTHGVWVLSDPHTIHVWLGRNGRAHPHIGCRCVSHFFDGDTMFGVASVETALLHLQRCEGDEAFFAAFESAWRQGKLSRAARARIRISLPSPSRWLVDVARPDADSGLESLVRLRLHVLGVRVECQVTIDGVGRVDFVISGRLIVEIDGTENHASPDHRRKDLRRDAAASALGYETLRFTYAQVVHDWPSVRAAILAALRRAHDHA
ncbi:MAG: DUF559 domain-containing protein [Microbacterium sp.]|nr:DUF559 domain-containing protein [Microbacterium sp.]